MSLQAEVADALSLLVPRAGRKVGEHLSHGLVAWGVDFGRSSNPFGTRERVIVIVVLCLCCSRRSLARVLSL